MDLIGIHEVRARFFDRNIRGGLSPDNIPNKKIREALERIVLKQADSPAVFAFKHNGVTLAAEKVDVTLRAMDRRQVDFAEMFLKQVAIFYSRQEGTFENLSDEDREDLGIESNKAIQIRQLAMTFMAVQGEIAMMSKIAETFESQKAYEATFRSSYLNVPANRIMLAYKMGLLMGSVIRVLREALPQKHDGAAARSKNLVWALFASGHTKQREVSGLVCERPSWTAPDS